MQRGEGVTACFSPLSEEQAQADVETLLHQQTSSHDITHTRWYLRDLATGIPWLKGCAPGSVKHQLQTLHFTRKLVTGFHVSPDPNYDHKWNMILAAYSEAVAHPQRCRIAFFDEMTYLRVPVLKPTYQPAGQENERIALPVRSNTQTRIAAALDACDGAVDSIQRSHITVTVLCNWLPVWVQAVRRRWPEVKRLYLVMDNWPVHHHPDFIQKAQELGVTLLFLPTYASWLNPIEKYWRWLRQEVIHSHPHANDLERLRSEVTEWLAQHSGPDPNNLFHTGLLSRDELAQHQPERSAVLCSPFG